MKKYTPGIFVILLLTATATAQYQFTIEKSLQCTDIQDQQATNTCWSFATTSFLESELLRTGQPAVNLSEMYNVRQIYLDKARNYLLRQGKANFAEGGLAHDVMHAVSTYGAIPEDIYPGKADAQEAHNHAELIVVLKAVLDGMLSKKVVSERWPEVVHAILDVYLGQVPENFNVGSRTYTPGTFARSLNLDTDAYVHITSFTHHPFYEKCVLEIPDNHANGSYYNVPLDDLVGIVRNAVDKGYTVAWDGDVSEPSFNAQHGIAVMPLQPRDDVFSMPGPELSYTPGERQRKFENFSTTDDHLMHIVGLAHDQNGARYYVVKNSWGKVGAYDGLLYMSEPYYRSKTIAITVHRDAIPADIAARIML